MQLASLLQLRLKVAKEVQYINPILERFITNLLSFELGIKDVIKLTFTVS